MRFLTIIISIIIGMALCAIFLGNGHPVYVKLEPFMPATVNGVPRAYPLWKVMVACVALGGLLGYLLGVTSGHYSHPKPSAPKPPPPQKAPEPDYLLVNNRRN